MGAFRPLIPFLPQIVKIGSASFQRKFVDILPFRAVKRLKKVVDDMEQTTVDILEYKKRDIDTGGHGVEGDVISGGKDLITQLCKSIPGR